MWPLHNYRPSVADAARIRAEATWEASGPVAGFLCADSNFSASGQQEVDLQCPDIARAGQLSQWLRRPTSLSEDPCVHERVDRSNVLSHYMITSREVRGGPEVVHGPPCMMSGIFCCSRLTARCTVDGEIETRRHVACPKLFGPRNYELLRHP